MARKLLDDRASCTQEHAEFVVKHNVAEVFYAPHLRSKDNDNDRLDRHFLACLPHHAHHNSVRLTALC